MRKFAYLVTTALLAAGAVTASAVTASAGTVGSCAAKGANANCATAVSVNHPSTLSVTVTASPNQSVIVAWGTSCSVGSSISSKDGTFTARTPVTRVLPHAFKHPDSCIVSAASGITGSGSVRVTLSNGATASHEVRGFGNMCADDTGNSTAAGTKIEAWTCYNGASEQWAFSHGELIHRGKCMNDKANGGSGSRVVLYTCTGAANELWTHNSHGEYVLKAHHGTLCLDDPAFSKKNGTPLVVFTCHNTANQHWTLP